MKNKNHKKIIVASMLATSAAAGGMIITSNQIVNAATDNDNQSETSEIHVKPELSEEKKAEIKAKLDAMTEEEKQEWLKNHKPRGDKRVKLDENSDGEGRPGKPANLTDEEWEQKKAELKEKLDAMTDEEKKEWLESHKSRDGKRSDRSTSSSQEAPSGE